MDENKASYETRGTLFYVKMYDGKAQTLIGLTEHDYRMLLMQGFKDEEVYLSLRREPREDGEYDVLLRASLNTIKMEGDPLFQLRLDVEQTTELRERGFMDGKEADIRIQMSPYRMPSKQLDPEKVDIHVFSDDDPILNELG